MQDIFELLHGQKTFLFDALILHPGKDGCHLFIRGG